MAKFTFDLSAFATVHIEADDEAHAREFLKDFDGSAVMEQLRLRKVSTETGDIVGTEVRDCEVSYSLDDSTADLVEVDGEAV